MSSGGGSSSTDGAAEAWPELERAERYARGAALKWASGVFCRPEQLERLGQYRKRESQRTSAIHSRLKSVVQSYLEGVGRGLQHLRHARAELRDATLSLSDAAAAARRNAEGSRPLDALREEAARHRQLLAAVSNLPRLYAVPSLVRDAERLIQSRRLLEGHARLRELQSWRDDLLAQLRPSPDGQSLAASYFGGVARVADGLSREVWAAVGAGFAAGPAQDPAPFVSAVRIVEREEALGQSDERGRGRGWRARFFEVVAETARERVRTASVLRPRGLAGHLSALQQRVVGDLNTSRYVLEGCVPAPYRLTAAYLRACHGALRTHLADVCNRELEGGEIFALLNWALHVYNSPEMMGDPALVAEVSPDELGPLVPPEGLEQLQNRYVQSVRSSVSEWMQKALEVEAADWRRDQEPDVDHEGYYHTSLPTIITQMLEENAQVALMISDSLRNQTIQMGLYELESFLNRWARVRVLSQNPLLPVQGGPAGLRAGASPRRPGRRPNGGGFYLHYLLAAISNCIVLKASTESLQQQRRPAPPGCPARTPPGPLGALDRAVRKACRLVLEDLLAELAPLTRTLLSRAWLANQELTREMCGALERRAEMYGRARPPCGQRLQEECQRLVVVEYARALMQKRTVCRGFEDRCQLARRMAQDGQQLREVFQGGDADAAPPGLEPPTALLPVLADFIQLRDPAMLTLEVSGLVAKYPDISVYRPLFPDVLLPPPSMPFCLPTAKCA
ncbi:hypothetical protein MATL_G00093300 [Megalops atlanticus]|uniref:Exocyst complex component 3-like protein n=1 Tax=Megalops atlanticus TaxID=7932 RepID=A0A9D3Q5V6_MEGAT|nr:hypothetical protein MATL_G00093300 [Megalops atlanticus]